VVKHTFKGFPLRRRNFPFQFFHTKRVFYGFTPLETGRDHCDNRQARPTYPPQLSSPHLTGVPDGMGWKWTRPTGPASELRPTTTTFQMLLGPEPPKAMRVKHSWWIGIGTGTGTGSGTGHILSNTHYEEGGQVTVRPATGTHWRPS